MIFNQELNLQSFSTKNGISHFAHRKTNGKVPPSCLSCKTRQVSMVVTLSKSTQRQGLYASGGPPVTGVRHQEFLIGRYVRIQDICDRDIDMVSTNSTSPYLKPGIPPPPKKKHTFPWVVLGYFFFVLNASHPFGGKTSECSLTQPCCKRRAVLFFEAAKVVGSEALGLSQRLLKHREQFLGSPNKMQGGGGGGWSQRLEGNT